jgi:hypothetical protein
VNLPAVLFAFRCLVRDTFRQAASSGISWLMLSVSGACILFCLSVGVSGDTSLRRTDDQPDFLPRDQSSSADSERLEKSGVDVISGDLTLGFGAMRVQLGRDREDAVRFIQLILAGGVADAAGILLVLIWTAGFLPTFLEPHAACVLLAKPLPRWSLLLGKYFGVIVFVAMQAALFVGGTSLALGIRTGVWDGLYLMAIPMLLVHFSIFFSVSVLIAVCTRNTVACVFGSVAFWFLCWGMNFGRHMIQALPDTGSASAGSLAIVEAGYWILPKPADLGLMLYDALQADSFFSRVTLATTYHPAASLAASFAFAIVVLIVSSRRLATTDY